MFSKDTPKGLIVNRLRELRKQKNMSQEDLRKCLNVAQPTLSGWESGKHQIDDANKIKLAKFFNVSVDYLLCLTDDPQKSVQEFNYHEKQLLDAYWNLNDEGRLELLQYADYLLGLEKYKRKNFAG